MGGEQKSVGGCGRISSSDERNQAAPTVSAFTLSDAEAGAGLWPTILVVIMD